MIHHVITEEERARRNRETIKEMIFDAVVIAPTVFGAIYVLLSLDTIVYSAKAFFGFM